MAYEITVITPGGSPVPPKRIPAAQVPVALAQAAANGTTVRIRPIPRTPPADDHTVREQPS